MERAQKMKSLLLCSAALTTVALATSQTISADETSSDVISVVETPNSGTSSSSTDVVTPVTPSEGGTDSSSTDVIVDVTPSDGDSSSSSSSEAGDSSSTGSDTDSSSSTETGETTPSVPDVNDAGGVNTDHTVPTTDGGTATVTPDKSVPTNNPNISSETANNAGASQVGTTSTVTGQVVQDVTTSNPVYTNGVTIVSTSNGQLLLSTGEYVAPETVGATTNSDKTITVTTEDGSKVTLPETGNEVLAEAAMSGIGAALLAGVAFLKRKNLKQFFTK